MSEHDSQPSIIVRKIKRVHGVHHGGEWKVAYADFMTAMMAFFLVMWILGQGTREQKAAISEYFKNPSMTPGTATIAPPGRAGPGGASDSPIKLGGGMDMSHGHGKDRHSGPAPVASSNDKSPQEISKRVRAQDMARLEELMAQMNAAIQKSQALAPFKDQLLLDITSEGLRIQIVDKLNRPMFDTASDHMKPYSEMILRELAGFVNKVPNKISISGHTDNTPYSRDGEYGNWELSADRANAARRALLSGGMAVDKVARVVGLADSVPFDQQHPDAPFNRRISLIVMNKEASDAASSPETAGLNAAPTAAPAAPNAAPPQRMGNRTPAIEPVSVIIPLTHPPADAVAPGASLPSLPTISPIVQAIGPKSSR
jgi:chemotaxis protein MotB